MKLKSIGLTLAIGIVLLAAPVFAGSINCGRGFVHVGDSKYKLLKRCGKPHDKTVTKIGLSSREEIWEYDFTGRLPHTVKIRDGKIISITP